MLRFEHCFEEDPRYGDLTVDIVETPPGVAIEFTTGDDGIWLLANAEGFLHLARIFAELGTRTDLGEGYHFHMPEWLKGRAEGSKQEVSVGLLDA
jgi:hypothetical protein